MVYEGADNPNGLTLYEAAETALQFWTFTGKDKIKDAARRAEEIAKLGLLDKLEDRSHRRINDLGRDTLERLKAEKKVVFFL